MSEFSCNTVRDMLPLYVDNIVSDDTRAIVEEHLTSCDACRKEYENMKNAIVLPADGDAKQLKRFKGAWKKKKRLVALTAGIATILALCIGYGIFDHFAYREEIAVNGAVYARSRETVSEIPEGSVELGYLRSILHRNIGSPTVDFSGTNLDEKYGGCGLYQNPENEMVIYLEDYGGFYIPFVLKEYIVQQETP